MCSRGGSGRSGELLGEPWTRRRQRRLGRYVTQWSRMRWLGALIVAATVQAVACGGTLATTPQDVDVLHDASLARDANADDVDATQSVPDSMAGDDVSEPEDSSGLDAPEAPDAWDAADASCEPLSQGGDAGPPAPYGQCCITSDLTACKPDFCCGQVGSHKGVWGHCLSCTGM